MSTFLSKPIENTKPRGNHNVNNVIRRCQCRFTSCNKRTTLDGNVDNVGGYAYVGAEGIWKFPVPSSSFCRELKTALKNQNLKKKRKKRRYPESDQASNPNFQFIRNTEAGGR